jgi:hypothetical protein
MQNNDKCIFSHFFSINGRVLKEVMNINEEGEKLWGRL